MVHLPAGTGDESPVTKALGVKLSASLTKKPSLPSRLNKANRAFANPLGAVLLDAHIQYRPFSLSEAYAYMNDTGVVKCYKTDRLIAFENVVLRQLPQKKCLYDGPVHLKMMVESDRGFETFPLQNFLGLLEESVLWGVHQIQSFSVTFTPSKEGDLRILRLTISKSI